MRADLTELVYILDKSGSMRPLTDDTIGGYNTMIEEQKKQPGEARVTTVLFGGNLENFSNEIKTVVDGKDINEVPELTTDDYVAFGNTPLYDAIGMTFTKIGKKLADTPESERPGKVIVTIVTDGIENTSREYNLAAIKKMIEEQRTKYNWVVMFIGANIDAETVGASMGISSKMSKTYTANSEGTKTLYASVSKGISGVRGMSAMGFASLDEVENSVSRNLDEIK